MNLSGIQPPQQQTDVFFHEFASFCLAAMISEVFRRPDPISSHNPVEGAYCCCPAEAGSPSFRGGRTATTFPSNPKKGKMGKNPSEREKPGDDMTNRREPA